MPRKLLTWIGCCIWILFSLNTFPPSLVFAQNADADKKTTPYDDLWQQVANLLEAREYGSASELIAEAQTEGEFKPFREQLKTDLKDLEGLQQLAEIVKQQASSLKAGDTYKQGGTTYLVQKFISDSQGDRLVLKPENGTTNVEKSLADLDAKGWVTLAQPKLTTSAADRYVLGMFLASVDHGDRKEARQALSQAATDGANVSHWVDRLDAEEKALQEAKTAKKAVRNDPILGTWRFSIGKKGKRKQFNLVLRENGKTNEAGATCRKRTDGTYALTFPKGGTAKVKLTPSGEVLKGNMASGVAVDGLREAKAKR